MVYIIPKRISSVEIMMGTWKGYGKSRLSVVSYPQPTNDLIAVSFDETNDEKNDDTNDQDRVSNK